MPISDEFRLSSNQRATRAGSNQCSVRGNAEPLCHSLLSVHVLSNSLPYFFLSNASLKKPEVTACYGSFVSVRPPPISFLFLCVSRSLMLSHDFLSLGSQIIEVKDIAGFVDPYLLAAMPTDGTMPINCSSVAL